MIRLALLLCLLALPLRAQDLLIRDVSVVDPDARTVRVGSVLVRNGVIVDVVAQAPPVYDGEVLDGSGKWLIPGLNDMHVHAFGNPSPGGGFDIMGAERAAAIMLYAGVTGFLDLFSPEEQIFAARERQRAGEVTGADIYAAGPILTSTGGHGTEYGIPTRIIDSPADARRVVDDLAKRRPDVVKIVYDHAGRLPTIDRATMQEAIKAAKGHNLKTVVHIGTWTDAREAVEAGATVITHTYGPDVVPDALVALMKKRKTVHIPTMAVETEIVNVMRMPGLLDDPLLASVTTPALLDAYRDTASYDPRARGFAAWIGRIRGSIPTSVGKLRKGGVRIVAGTDAGNLGTFQGYSLHRELELMVAAGMSPYEALAAATTSAGELVGQRYGVRPGDVANLVLLDASPVEAIANTKRIWAVVHHGRVIDRDALLNPPSKAWSLATIDDFSDADLASAAGPRWSVDTDSILGGSSTATVELTGDGTMSVRGHLKSKPGMPALAGVSLMLSPGSPLDMSRYTGVRLRIRPSAGAIQFKVMTTSVRNYDFHAYVIPNASEMQTVEIPFAGLRQLWSAQVPWTGTDVLGFALWATSFGAEADYAFVVDSVELY